MISIKQQEDKTLRSYIAYFNKEVLSIDEADDKILVAAFTNGLRKGKFLFSLYKNDSKTMSDLLYRATKYMNVEDWPKRRNSKREKDKKTHGKTRGRRWQELENEGMTSALSPLQGGSRASPH